MMLLLSVIVLKVILHFSSAAEISPSNGSFCLGQVSQWTCTSNGSLEWQNQPIGQAFPLNTIYSTANSETQPERPLGSRGPFYVTVTCVRGTIFESKASANMTLALNGTQLECAGEGEDFGTTAAAIDLILKDPASISYINVKEMSTTEVMVTWDGAECVDYYVIECGAYRNTTTSERLVIQPGNNCFSCVVSGINFFGQNFTFMRTEFFCLREYMFNIQPVVDNSTLYIVIEASVTNQPLITSCLISLNATEKSCSETMKVVSFDVVPGSYYEYSVMINNVIGLSTSSGNIDISSCPTVTPTSSPCPTNTPCPTSTPCSPPVKCGPWFILFIIAAVAFAISFLIINCLCLRICIFEKRMCCSKCQNNPVWRQIFCYKGCATTEVATDTDKKKLEDKISSL